MQNYEGFKEGVDVHLSRIYASKYLESIVRFAINI